MILTAKQIKELFVHRKDVFAKQLPNGAYIPVRREITDDDIDEHLKGNKTYGLYCLNTDNTIKWSCIDLDGDESRLTALKIEGEKIYSLFPEFSRMLEFSGRKGYHVWIFFNKPVQASYGQQLIKSRLNKEGIRGHEIFPKQTELNQNRRYGNLVKIPLALHKVSGKRSEIIKAEGQLWQDLK